MTTIKGLFSPLKKSKALALNSGNVILSRRINLQLLNPSISNKAICTTSRVQFRGNPLDKKADMAPLVDVPDITDEEVEIVVEEPDSTVVNEKGTKIPIVILFGWAGASQKNLRKYAAIYLEAGYTTVQYNLSTRHIFRDTDQVPALMSRLMEQLEKKNLFNRPMFIHCLSDTGVMCYQGMDIASTQSKKLLNVKGVLWDSCPGPYPEVTLPRVVAFLIVNWMCCYKDNMGITQSLYSSYRLLLDRGWPNLMRRWQGKPVTLNLINGIWCGHFGRDHHLQHPEVRELFLYSNKDFYLPVKYLEKEVLQVRKELGADFSVVKFKGSPHVAHLKHHKKKYKNSVVSFVESTSEDFEENISVNVEEENKEKLSQDKVEDFEEEIEYEKYKHLLRG